MTDGIIFEKGHSGQRRGRASFPRQRIEQSTNVPPLFSQQQPRRGGTSALVLFITIRYRSLVLQNELTVTGGNVWKGTRIDDTKPFRPLDSQVRI